MLSPRQQAVDIDVPLPPGLLHYGPTIKARLTGNPAGPLIAALGGISGNRFVCEDADGSPGWWPGLVGRGCAVDPAQCEVLGLDFAADASGISAPSTADQAIALAAALDQTGRERFDAIVGASYGGMVALAFSERFPSRLGRLAILSAGAEPHPAATAARELQRRVVALGLAHGKGTEALSIARGLAMLTYRTPEEFAVRFRGGISEDAPLACSEPGSYLRARGEAFGAVMTPERFLSLSASVDRHRVSAERITADALLVGATSDQLVPPCQMKELAQQLGGKTRLELRDCIYGHDMFLKDAGAIGAIIGPFLAGGL